MNYDQDTRFAYLTPERAAVYHYRHTRSWTWSRVSTSFELKAVASLLDRAMPHGLAVVLDAPCGTGVAAPLLRTRARSIVAADISMEMMRHARSAYESAFTRFVRADLTQLPWGSGAFDATLTLGFLHRVPASVRRMVLAELARVSRRFVIVSCSIDSATQRFKHSLLRRVSAGHAPAPSPVSLAELEIDCAAAGLAIRTRVAIAAFLSAESVFLLERR